MDTGRAQRGPWSTGRHVPRKVAILPRGIAIAARKWRFGPLCDLNSCEHGLHTQLGHPITCTALGSHIGSIGWPPVSSRFLRARCVHRHTAPTRPRASQPPVSPSTCLGVTRQYAAAFNQPLSLDTSRVTDMSYMFYRHRHRPLGRRRLRRVEP